MVNGGRYLMPDSEKKSILKDVNDLIDSELGLMDIGKAPHHEHGESCRRLTKLPMTGITLDLIAKIYDQIGKNWDASKYHKGSEENWRFEKNTRIESKSPEVRLERAIVNIPEEIWPDAKCWVNQVPVASGLVDPRADRSRNIDLVHKCDDKVYEFIELKIGSNTPLYAAMEILKYGVLYIFCRQDDRVKCVDRKGKLMQAKKIHLKVLAPAKYYEKYDLSWLEKDIKNGLGKFLAQRKFAFEMDFMFETLLLIPSRSPVTWKV
jgi:hypothetical protein